MDSAREPRKCEKMKTTENQKKQTKPKAEEKTPEPKPQWAQGDQTHGHGEYDLYGIAGLIREKGCREIGMMQTRIYLSSRADPPICNRGDKYTVVLTGTHEKASTDLNMDRLQKVGAADRKAAMSLARHPSEWSTKAQTIVAKIAAEKEAKEAAKQEKAKETKPEPEATA